MFGHVVTYCNTQSSSDTGARGLPRRCQNGDVIPRQRAPRRVALGWESSGVRGCPGAASEDYKKPLANFSQGFFVIRDASLAIRPDRAPFAGSTAGSPAKIAARRASTTDAATGPGTSPTQPPASPTTHQAPSRKREQQAPACGRRAPGETPGTLTARLPPRHYRLEAERAAAVAPIVDARRRALVRLL